MNVDVDESVRRVLGNPAGKVKCVEKAFEESLRVVIEKLYKTTEKNRIVRSLQEIMSWFTSRSELRIILLPRHTSFFVIKFSE